MLKAYDYIEYSENAIQAFHIRHFDEELQIAEALVKKLTEVANKTASNASCQCGQERLPLFFTKWGIDYCRCPKCKTVVADASKELVIDYKNNQNMINFRTSEEYQAEAAARREKSWEELLNWVCFRTFRYLRKREFNIIDYGSRYSMLSQRIEESKFCESYEIRDSIMSYNAKKPLPNGAKADIVLNLNNLQQSVDPVKDIRLAGEGLRKGGLMFFSTRIGTGFDILTLREHSKIYPFEHVFLPSMMLLSDIFAKAGYKVLETTTPGMLDTLFVKDNESKIREDELFVKYMMSHCDVAVLQDFQRFLQKSSLSSYTQIVVRKEAD